MTDASITIRVKSGTVKAFKAVPECGSGPALILLPEVFATEARVHQLARFYAEEGYVVLAPALFGEPPRSGEPEPGYRDVVEKHQRFDLARGAAELAATVEAARALTEVTGKGGAKQVGVLGLGLGGTLACLAAVRSSVDCAVAYAPVGLDAVLAGEGLGHTPLVVHFGARDELVPPATIEALRARWAGRPDTELYVYPGGGHDFTRMDSPAYSKPSVSLAHSRSLTLLRGVMGPHYDLSTLWDMHCGAEFVTHDADAAIATMASVPYVNHVPTMTGGRGKSELRRFYAEFFIPNNPRDMQLLPITRTVGVDRVVDEMLVCFTHDVEMDVLLPGVPPTGKYVEIPMVAIVQFRGGKVANEHIYWDQASALVQLGVLNPEGLPVGGVEVARKLMDETLPLNTLMKRWVTGSK